VTNPVDKTVDSLQLNNTGACLNNKHLRYALKLHKIDIFLSLKRPYNNALG